MIDNGLIRLGGGSHGRQRKELKEALTAGCQEPVPGLCGGIHGNGVLLGPLKHALEETPSLVICEDRGCSGQGSRGRVSHTCITVLGAHPLPGHILDLDGDTAGPSSGHSFSFALQLQLQRLHTGLLSSSP